jgi:hypothetical protein
VAVLREMGNPFEEPPVKTKSQNRGNNLQHLMVQLWLMLSLGTSKTFQEYGEKVFASYIYNQLEKSNRVDDVYLPASLKDSTREKRGKGTRKRVAPSTVTPKNWMDFLRVNENKIELFTFLSRKVVDFPLAEGKEIYATGTQLSCCVVRGPPCPMFTRGG